MCYPYPLVLGAHVLFLLNYMLKTSQRVQVSSYFMKIKNGLEVLNHEQFWMIWFPIANAYIVFKIVKLLILYVNILVLVIVLIVEMLYNELLVFSL